MKKIALSFLIIVTYNFILTAQNAIVNSASGNWSSLIQLDNFDPIDDQQSSADSDFVGNATFPIMETQKEIVVFNDGVTDDVYYFRVRMGQSNPNTSFYFGLDVNGDYIADLFIEANVKSQTPYVSFHLRDQSKSGLSPSQTSWLNGTQNNELFLTSRNAAISDYKANTDIDGGNSGTDYWIEFAFTEESLKSYVLDNFNLSISGDSAIALYGFTSTSQTSNGDVLGVDDTIPGVLDTSWVDLGIVISGSLNNIASGDIVAPTVNSLTTENTLPTITGTWGGSMLGDDSLSITVDNSIYTTDNGLIIDNLNWSLPVNEPLSPNTYDVKATTYRGSSNKSISDTTSNELVITVIPDIPFNCDYNAYLFQYNDVYAIDLASGNSFTVATDITEGNINATAYNPVDNFIWGSLSSPEKSIVRIGENFNTTTYYIDELPTSGLYVGDISSVGIYYLKGGGTTYYALDLNPNSVNYGNYIETLNLTQDINIHDWAFNAVDNKLYSVEKDTNILYRIDAVNGTMESLGEVPILSGLNYTYGAVYFDASGHFYVSANQTGAIYIIKNVQDLTGINAIDSNIFAFGPSSSSNDGARCPTAPVPQEDCTNGIDDDGDGLIDCEDPSCSGYASCPVIEAETSGGNEGGLESNNRLSEQISKRNFNRAKSSYKFDKASAKKFSKSKTSYGKASLVKGALQLSDFIPLGIINENDVIESSPVDLIGITNATDVYSVDYMRRNQVVASLLILKTDTGVYEHTKYICDRLLGAQLISVSTIEIKGQKFIKSLIRNIEGNLEFVMSFSAKAINNDTSFSIESHWNLDKYENNIGFYNFQIWSNSLDDLLKLGEEALRLLEVQKPILSYNNSTPPSVFVRSGKYHKGKLDLQIVNTNRSNHVDFDGGLRVSETENVEYVTSTIDLNGDYISNIEVDSGSLFDIGFRIGDGIHTPDDLFMSDGPWGYDDAAPTTTVTNYTVGANEIQFDENEFPVERNINLKATTSQYIAAYRALTPKFNPIDLTSYNSFKLKAKGTGELVVRLVKESIGVWEEQYKTSIVLTEILKDYSLKFSEFRSISGVPINPNDVTSIVFTMLAENGEETIKEMTLEQLRFSIDNSYSKTALIEENGSDIEAVPNPMNYETNIYFKADNAEKLHLVIYNHIGQLVKRIEFTSIQGENILKLERENFNSGVYYCEIKSNNSVYKTLKLLME